MNESRTFKQNVVIDVVLVSSLVTLVLFCVSFGFSLSLSLSLFFANLKIHQEEKQLFYRQKNRGNLFGYF